MAGGGFFLEGEDEVGGVVRLFVDFAGKEVVEVVQEWDVEEVSVRGGDRNVYRLYLEEGVGVLEELEHVFADGGADGGGPVVFVGAVCGYEEYEVDLVFAQEEGVTVEETVFEVFVGLRLVVAWAEGWCVEVEGVALNLRAYEEVRGDVVAFGVFVAVADGVGICLVLDVVLVDVVLDGVAGVGELLVERHTFDVVAIAVVFAIADVVYVGVLAYEGLVHVDMVDELAVLLVLEGCELAGVSDESVHHLFEDCVEFFDGEGFFAWAFVIMAVVEREECVQECP